MSEVIIYFDKTEENLSCACTKISDGKTVSRSHAPKPAFNTWLKFILFIN
jgi:hypothetical protein